MTRKRFKKLCMSLGVQRNIADFYALIGYVLSRNYTKAWESFLAAFQDYNSPVMPLPEKEVSSCE